MPFFKALFKPDAPLAFTNLNWTLAAAGDQKITVGLGLINSTGTAILLAVLATILVSGKSLGVARSNDLKKPARNYGFPSPPSASFLPLPNSLLTPA
ncbi:hypothetical protein [Neisseria wadsworthii]|uniref:hypothetical protein n=1 Tax=Neisseria wadsworthii TaxID=607711 RepID=UPI001F1A3D67|nr:hypothetical protein [Neisseria wadsworthii]